MVKPSTLIKENTPIKILEDRVSYVSRGGIKLQHALHKFDIEVRDKKCIDIGSSTGGFVDCLLKNGAEKVIAVDVGKGQLDYKLRNDSRVFLMENTNARYLTEKDINLIPDLITADVSFISLKKIFPALERVSKKGKTSFLFLVKPQFETEVKNIKKGIVKEPEVHIKVLQDFWKYFKEKAYRIDFTYSPIKGSKGNIEYFMYIRKGKEKRTKKKDIKTLVNSAHQKLIK